LEFRGTQLSSDGGLLVMRELDDALGLSDLASAALAEVAVTAMHLTTVRTQTERKRQDRSVRRAEKLRCHAGMTRVRGLIRPTPGVWATADTARDEKTCSARRFR